MEVHLCHILESTYKCYHIVFVPLFLIYFTSMIIFRSIDVAANGIVLLFFKKNIYFLIEGYLFYRILLFSVRH